MWPIWTNHSSNVKLMEGVLNFATQFPNSRFFYNLEHEKLWQNVFQVFYNMLWFCSIKKNYSLHMDIIEILINESEFSFQFSFPAYRFRRVLPSQWWFFKSCSSNLWLNPVYLKSTKVFWLMISSENYHRHKGLSSLAHLVPAVMAHFFHICCLV